MPDPAVAAMQNVLRQLTPRQTAALLSCMQGCEPEAFRFALDYAQSVCRADRQSDRRFPMRPTAFNMIAFALVFLLAVIGLIAIGDALLK